MKAAEIRTLLRPRRPEIRSDRRVLARSHTIDDLQRAARRRLPRAVFDYLDGGSEEEVSLARNRQAFMRYALVPQYLRDVDHVDTTTRVLGSDWALPFALAPTGFSRMMHPAGERAVARAARDAGVPYTLSTMATTSIEDVAGVGAGERWFQLFVWRDRPMTRELIARARDAGYRVLMLTVDTAVAGGRERDLRNGLTIPPTLTASTLVDGVRHPRWWLGLLRHEALMFSNLTQPGFAPTVGMSFAAKGFDPTLSWEDLGWIREEWPGPFVIKGIQSLSDARQAAAHGVDGIVLSNHGGRQLDHGQAPLALVADAVDEVGSDLEVLVDSGFRRGSDIVKALCLGARGVMLGRAYLYGLSAAGEAGVRRSIDIVAHEVRRTMQLLGVTSIPGLTRAHLCDLDHWDHKGAIS